MRGRRTADPTPGRAALERPLAIIPAFTFAATAVVVQG
jgi:hypothetical protein